eukprot:Blabericola_migrator_1__7394@NODE_3763_length_1527_cov_14_115753_g2338_i0_p1_GENE_NODE_3763_length_1527_cov_14_115753_g2338_i0NODE_3763_length_1527_cov_14_115753_g2338_i0_p1_ORF_typecomplete_len410_score33_34rve/PF00665_26/5_4e24DDE_2/PF02914_15/0_021rve_3/PF13683_6/3_2e03rve_3/PF13683_6/0_026DDE_3/PF13358_6/0_014DDE_1/PF03184_19/0_17_NODE_3763_length_1527_cov_14_115753_g2338_i0831312
MSYSCVTLRRQSIVPYMDIAAYNRRCWLCARRRWIPSKAPGVTQRALGLFEVVAADTWSIAFEGTTHHFLTMVDHFSKEVQVERVESENAFQIWEKFYNRWITRYGTPRLLLTDNGSPFKSDYFRDRCRDFGIVRSFTSPYHPQANACIETVHKHLNKAVSISGEHTGWSLEEVLSSTLYAYRSSPHFQTNATPFYLLHGMEMCLPTLQSFQTRLEWSQPLQTRMTLLMRTREEMTRHYLDMRLAQGDMQGRLKQNWIPKEGDLVLVDVSEKPTGGTIGIHKNNKLRLRFTMPKVVAKISPDHLKVTVRELWSSKEEEVAYHRVVPLEPPIFAEELEEAGLEVVTDLQQSSMPSSRLSQTPLHRIPAEELPVVRKRLHSLQGILQQAKRRRETEETETTSGAVAQEGEC